MAKKKAAKVAEDQPVLVNLETAQSEVMDLPLEALPSNAVLDSPEPSHQFIADIREHGQIVPIVVVLQDNGMYWVREGRNRIKTARILGKKTIQAKVYTNIGELEALTITTVANAHRRSNPIADLAVIERLRNLGKPLRLSGLPSATIRKLEKLASLEPEFITAIQTGKLSVSAAETIATLEKKQRKDLCSRAKQGKKITANDVALAKRVQTTGAAAEYADLLNEEIVPEKERYVVMDPADDQVRGYSTLLDQARGLADILGKKSPTNPFKVYRLIEV